MKNPIVLNKKNLKEFAKHLYTKKGGYVYYQPLCRKKLVEKSKNEIVHCIIAEMLNYFTGKEILKDFEESDIIDFFVIFSDLKLNKRKDNFRRVRAKFSNALEDLIELNDSIECNDSVEIDDLIDTETKTQEEAFIERARQCSEKINKIADKFLN